MYVSFTLSAMTNMKDYLADKDTLKRHEVFTIVIASQITLLNWLFVLDKLSLANYRASKYASFIKLTIFCLT